VDPAFPCIVQVEVHLSGVGMGELADLQVDDHQTSQATMEKDEVHPIPFVADAQTLLPADEAEIPAKLQSAELGSGHGERMTIKDLCLKQPRSLGLKLTFRTCKKKFQKLCELLQIYALTYLYYNE